MKDDERHRFDGASSILESGHLAGFEPGRTAFELDDIEFDLIGSSRLDSQLNGISYSRPWPPTRSVKKDNMKASRLSPGSKGSL